MNTSDVSTDESIDESTDEYIDESTDSNNESIDDTEMIETTEEEEQYQMDGTMPEGYEPVGGYTEDCCGSSYCVLGSECKCTLATYVRFGIRRKIRNGHQPTPRAR